MTCSPPAHPNPPTAIDFGSLRSLSPIDADFGGGRGKPIDRHYIEGFLARHAGDVRGCVLEVGGDDYTRRFGGSRVTQRDILHADDSNPHATVIADLANADAADRLAGQAFDCFICTQTLQYVFRLDRAIETVHRMLAPGGCWLITVPGISQISPYDRDRWGEYWRFTPQSLARLLGEAFDDVDVQAHGNVLAATGFLQGLACDDLTVAELDHQDDRYPMLITARAVKRGGAGPAQAHDDSGLLARGAGA